MNPSNSWSKRALSLCAEIGPEDGIAPRYLTRKSMSDKTTRKTLQLCKKVQQTLSLLLAGDSSMLLRELFIVSVVPINEQHMRVTIAQLPSASEYSEKQILTELALHKGRYRTALAQALHRKHTPSLVFCYAGVVAQGGV